MLSTFILSPGRLTEALSKRVISAVERLPWRVENGWSCEVGNGEAKLELGTRGLGLWL